MAAKTKMPEYKIVLVHIKDRMANSGLVQKILSEYGCSIRTRIGFHEASEEFCATNGLVILQMIDKDKEIITKLGKIKGVEVKGLNFK